MPSRIQSLDKRFTLSDSERRFRKACDQIVMLNQRLGDVQKRYKAAKRSNNRSFRYNLRLKLAVIEGARNMYYEYAYAKADKVAELRRELFDESVEIVSGSDSEYSSDSDWVYMDVNRKSFSKNGPFQSQPNFHENILLVRAVKHTHTHTILPHST